MYRLADMQDKELQKIISTELVHGFDEFLNKDGCLHKDDIEDVMGPFEDYLFENLGKELNDEDRKSIRAYMKALRDELADPDAEYTFDEYGERTMYYLMRYSFEALTGDWEPNQENIAFIVKYWKTSAKFKDVAYVRETATDFFAGVMAEEYKDTKDDPEFSIYECAQGTLADVRSFIDRCMYFPLMWTSLETGAFCDLLWWDTDFMWIDEYGEEGFNAFRASEMGTMLGMMQVTKDSMPITHSYRYPLKETTA